MLWARAAKAANTSAASVIVQGQLVKQTQSAYPRATLALSRSFWGSARDGRHEPFTPIPHKSPVMMSKPVDCFEHLASGSNVFIHGGGATPAPLVEGLAKGAVKYNVTDIKLHHIHLEGPAHFLNEECRDRFRSNSLFIGGNCRTAVNAGEADATPVFLQEIAQLFRRKVIPIDVAIVHLSPPDKHGYCTMGVSVDCTRAALQQAGMIIALINPEMPRIHGDAGVHISHVDYAVEMSTPIPELKSAPPSDVEAQIGKLIAENLVEDGATLQMGIGSIPNAALAALKGHKNLGIHSEMFSDGVIELVRRGVVTNSDKVLDTGILTSTFALGTRNLYDFVDDNPFVQLRDVEYTNDPHLIAQNPKVTAINSCIEIDITGQVCADSIGTRMYSGFGGQVDFIRGASICPTGKPIIALPSTTKKGTSRIVPILHPGAGVTTSRGHVHYVVTEYGIANLYGKSLRERARLLIDIAHPDHREELERQATERYKCII